MAKIIISEEQCKRLFEGVYVSDVKGDNAILSYQKGGGYQKGNLNTTDYLKTDKMDKNDSDTYMVPLKGGIMSYNITSIRGTEVMHYFKNLWDGKDNYISVNGDDNKKYKLKMLSKEFEEFKKQFLSKVGSVVEYCIKGFGVNNIEAVSIYPVPSSSKFNEKMANEISSDNINGLTIQVINKDMLVKDMRNLERDEDFIDKNKDYYNGKYVIGNHGDETVNDYVDSFVNKYSKIGSISPMINELNKCLEKIINKINNYKTCLKLGRDSENMAMGMAELYKKYYDIYIGIVTNHFTYEDPSNKKVSRIQPRELIAKLKYSKGPSTEKRTDFVWNLIKPYLRGQTSNVTNKPYTKIELCQWRIPKFEIKSITNSQRMGVRNIFNPTEDENIVQKELERIKGTALIIFDDNISGGATLGDICYQFKKLGVDYIIPITFGKMKKKTTLGVLPLSVPTNSKGEKDFNY